MQKYGNFEQKKQHMNIIMIHNSNLLNIKALHCILQYTLLPHPLLQNKLFFTYVFCQTLIRFNGSSIKLCQKAAAVTDIFFRSSRRGNNAVHSWFVYVIQIPHLQTFMRFICCCFFFLMLWRYFHFLGKNHVQGNKRNSMN